MNTETTKTTKTPSIREQAEGQIESIMELVKALTDARAIDDESAMEYARLAISEDALSVEVRSGWVTLGTPFPEAAEFKILLATGGPASRIVGTLDRGEPESARLEWQDWGTPWTEVPVTSEEQEAILTYAREFYFGS